MRQEEVSLEYIYELWNGKKAVGSFRSRQRLIGAFMALPEPLSAFGRKPRGGKLTLLKVPLLYRIVSDNGIDIHYRLCLDVRRLSKRQRQILMEYK